MEITKKNYMALLKSRLNYLYSDLKDGQSDGICIADFDAADDVANSFKDKGSADKLSAVRQYFDADSRPSKADVAKLLNDDFTAIDMQLN